MIAFGPVPSRRLGSSLGINHIPPKHCPYSCVYCQVGRTTKLEITRQEFYPLSQVLDEVGTKIAEIMKAGGTIDFLSLVPDGEPTLDLHLSRLIEGLKPFGIPIAVISNASLIDSGEVQDALMQADWISLKVDAVTDTAWRRINRPYRRLSLTSILTGILNFRGKFQGKLVTETMLIAGINDSESAIHNLASYLLELQPFKAFLSIPTRPPAESWVRTPDAGSLQKILAILAQNITFAEFLFENDDADFRSTGDLVEDILGITAVHPMREEALRQMVARSGASWKIVEDLLSSKKITCVHYREERFYLRNLNGINTGYETEE